MNVSWCRLICAVAALGCGVPLGGCRSLSSGNPSVTPTESLETQLGTDDWQRAPDIAPASGHIGPSQNAAAIVALRWRLAADADGEGADEISTKALVELARQDSLPGWNAAILLAQRDAAAGAEFATSLERLVSDPPAYDSQTRRNASSREIAPRVNPRELWTKLNGRRTDVSEPAPVELSAEIRAAAAEAWCRVLAVSAGGPDKLLAAVEPALQRDDLPEEVRIELWHGLERSLPAARIPGLDAVIADTTAPSALRRAALDAHIASALAHPGEAASAASPGVLACANDPEPELRVLFGRWAAASRQPDALSTLKRQISDVDPRVRDQAVLSLGLLRTDEARDELRRLARTSPERARRTVVGSLANWGPSELVPFAADESFLVRQTVVEQLARFPEAASALLLKSLVSDPHPHVQRAVSESLASWPDSLALPILLEGLRSNAYATRRLCLTAIELRTGRSIAFRSEGSAEEREADVARLAQQLGGDAGILKELRQSGVRAVSASSNGMAEESLRNALGSLDSPDVAVRRRGAGELRELAERSSLGPESVKALRGPLSRESDGLVWQDALQAVLDDASDEAAELALLALNHPLPEVRVAGCRHVERHARASQALWLLPLLRDSNRSVQLAAIRAAGGCGNAAVLDGLPAGPGQEPLPGMRALLTGSDRDLQFAVIVAMSRLGDEQGIDEMLRLVYSRKPQFRREVVIAMGLTRQARFIEPLIRLGEWEEDGGVRVAVLASLEELTPEGERPPGLARQSNIGDKIRCWADWRDQIRKDRGDVAAETGIRAE